MKTTVLASLPLILLAGCTQAPTKTMEAKYALIGQHMKLEKLDEPRAVDETYTPGNSRVVSLTTPPFNITTLACTATGQTFTVQPGADIGASFGDEIVSPTVSTSFAGTGGTCNFTGTLNYKLTFTVTPPPPANGIPATASTSGILDSSTKWVMVHDPGTPGTSVGTSNYPISGWSADNKTRSFMVSYTGAGGELFHVSWGNSLTATHFVYDTNVYLYNTAVIANVEMDMNQVTADGKTYIFGVQCDGYSGTWDITSMSPSSHWNHTTVPCNPRNWAAKQYHHIQIASHRDNNGNITYDWVAVDGKVSNIGVTYPSAENLGWAKGVLLTNFQLDGLGASGTIQAYNDKMQIWYW